MAFSIYGRKIFVSTSDEGTVKLDTGPGDRLMTADQTLVLIKELYEAIPEDVRPEPVVDRDNKVTIGPLTATLAPEQVDKLHGTGDLPPWAGADFITAVVRRTGQTTRFVKSVDVDSDDLSMYRRDDGVLYSVSLMLEVLTDIQVAS